MFVAATLFSFIIGSVFWGSGEPGNNISSIIYQFIVLIGFHALYYMISIIVGKTGGSIAFNIVAPMIVSMIFTIGDGLIHLGNFHFGDYWMSSFMATAQEPPADAGKIVLALVASLVYAVVFFVIGLMINKKKQL